MILRPYQLHAVEHLAAHDRAFVVAPAGSGKTIMAAAALAQVAKPFDRVVWLANTIEQCAQAREAIQRCHVDPAVDLDVRCVAAAPDVTGAEIVIVDEAHHLPAPTWWSTVGRSVGRVWGLSATPWSTDQERNERLRAFFGAHFHVVDREQVKQTGSITDGVVYIHDVDRPGCFDDGIERFVRTETKKRCRKWRLVPREEHERRARWQATAEKLRTNIRRNDRIAWIASESSAAGESVLVLVGSIEHGEELAGAIKDAVMVHAGIGRRKRAEIVSGFRDGRVKVMVATSLADEGLDVPCASVLVLAAGGRSPGKVEQRTGRVMRPHAGKRFGEVHDFADRGARLAHAQFLSRLKTYRKLGYLVQ